MKIVKRKVIHLYRVSAGGRMGGMAFCARMPIFIACPPGTVAGMEDGMMGSAFVCPRCGSPLLLREYGTYSGSRLLTEDGAIVPDSYSDDGDGVDRFVLECTATGCTYERTGVEVYEDQVIVEA